jgi:hypothetical protein
MKYLENEIWKDIPNYEGLYQVSNLGRVKALERVFTRKDGIEIRRNERIVNQTLNTYYYVQLRKDRKNIHFAVHRLVCMAFYPNPNNYPCVNHKDENKLNNNVDNLEWCTQKYNLNYGKCKESWLKSFVPNFGRKIDVYTKYGVFVKSYNSVVEAEMDGYNKNSIFKCLFGRLDSHRGLVFKKHGEPFSYKNRSLNVFVKRISEMDGSEKIYNTIVDAAKDNGLTKDKLGAFYRGTQKNVPIGGYKYEFFTA